jgi:RHS repeat-associated protein
MADGRVAAFPVLYHGESYYHPREKIWLHRKQNGHFLLEDHTEGLYYHFNYDQQPGAWHLSFIENYSGHRIQFHYNGLHCNAITDSAGRRLFLTLDKQHRITQVRVQHRGMEQLLVSYAYNEAGDLVQITDALNQPVLIEYHHHLMIKKTDRNGQCFYWEYDTHNRCVHTWGNGGILEGRIAYHRGYNEVTNSLGETTTYYYDEFNLCIQETDHYGNNRYTEYTDNFDVYREIDEEGNITGYAYDQQARLTEKTLPDGSTMQFSYNEYNQPTLIIHPDGNSETYGYDALHRIQFINYPNGKTVTYEYNDEGQLEAVIETGNRKTVLTWDEDENLAGMQWTDGAVAHWKYDALGRCIKTINTTGEVRYFEYDPLSRLSHAYLPDGNLVTLAYNAYKEVIQATDRHNTIHYEYTPLGSLKKQTRNNRVLELLYDTEERLRTVVNEAGRHYVFGYNKRGEVISETGFGGLQKQYQRDATGKVIKALRPGGRFTQYEYDANGRITRVEYDDGSWEGYLYDKNGELLEAINEYSRVQFTRNKQGYVETEQQDGYLVHSVYSKSGERMQVTSNLGANIQLQRNKQGKVTNMQATQHNLLWEAQMKYNQAGQEIERILPGSLCSEWQYDRAGRPGEHKVVQRGVVQSWKKYTWDVNDRLVNVFDALSRGNTQFRHDALGNLVFAQYADNSIVHRAMDATGNIYETAGRNERRYNSAGALLESEWFIYKYDEEGNLLSKTNKATRQQTTYEWYANGRLKQVTRADGKKVTFTYDALGRRISKCFAGKITRWVWDGDRPLHEWSYNEKDKPQAVVNEWGEITYNKPEPNPHNALDEVAGITWVFDAESHRLAAKIVKGATYSVINDHTGAPQWMYDAAGKKVWEGVLDIYGRIRSLYGHAGDMPFRYPGQYEDAETGLYYNRFRYYDPASGAYISQDPVGLLGGMRLYSYVPDTNTWVDIFGLAGTGKAWLNYAKQYHDKRADEIFGEGKGRSVGGRNYDKFHEGKDIEYKSDNFSKGPRAEDSLKRMNTQIDKDIANKLAGDADPHWHFEHDPSVAEEMKPLLKKMDDNGITRTHGKTFPGFPGCN